MRKTGIRRAIVGCCMVFAALGAAAPAANATPTNGDCNHISDLVAGDPPMVFFANGRSETMSQEEFDNLHVGGCLPDGDSID